MTWKIKWLESARRELRKLDKPIQDRILRYMSTLVAPDPRRSGSELKGNMAGLWRYRVGDYRVVCEIIDAEVIVIVFRVGHRKDVYD